MQWKAEQKKKRKKNTSLLTATITKLPSTKKNRERKSGVAKLNSNKSMTFSNYS